MKIKNKSLFRKIMDGIWWHLTHRHVWGKTGRWTYDWQEHKCADCPALRYVGHV